MLTVKQQYVKPLEIIWSKCANLGWGPHNTIHVDDLERNFELNKQCGVLISPFHLKPVPNGIGSGPCSVAADGTSTLDGTPSAFGMPPPPNSSQRRPSFGTLTNGNGHSSEAAPSLPKAISSSKLTVSNKGFEDIELQLLARYLVYIAVTVSDFSAVDHSLWRTRALEMPKER